MKKISYYKSPLTIYVVWHHKNTAGLLYAEAIYGAFCRDVDNPLGRALGIPVYFRFVNSIDGSNPLSIRTSESDKNAIVLLADDEMFLDETWSGYIQSILDLEDENSRIFPVAFSSYAYSIDEKRLSKKQFINLTDLQAAKNPFEEIFRKLRSRLLHDLSRFLFKIEKVSEIESQRIEPPVKLFISHAKIDGESLAIRFRDYINSTTKLKSFFDVNDIEDAGDFEEAIKRNLKNSAIVVFLTDKYSSREWCRIEVIVAKRNKSPLVVVNNIEIGEKRSFPYLGNTPTIKFNGDNFEEIIDLALFQILNNLFLHQILQKEIVLHGLDKKYHPIPLENTPELFNYIDIKKIQLSKKSNPLLVIYPDPPLGLEELNVLNDLGENIMFITPSTIHLLQ